jgi:hypothetical protein
MRSCVALSIATLVLLLVGAAAAAPRPTLTLVTRSTGQVAVHGTQFGAFERIRVRFAGMNAETPAITVRTNADGAFTLPAPAETATDPCGAEFAVSATGATGGTALVRRPPRECAPAAPNGPVTPAAATSGPVAPVPAPA